MILILVLITIISIFEIKKMIKDKSFKGIIIYILWNLINMSLIIYYSKNPFGMTYVELISSIFKIKK